MPEEFRCLSRSFHHHSPCPWHTLTGARALLFCLSPGTGSVGGLTEPACPQEVTAQSQPLPVEYGEAPSTGTKPLRINPNSIIASNLKVQRISVLFGRLAPLELNCASWLPGVNFIRDGSTTHPETPASLFTVAGLWQQVLLDSGVYERSITLHTWKGQRSGICIPSRFTDCETATNMDTQAQCYSWNILEY